MNDNPYVAPQANLSVATSEEPAPPLWNPNSAALWSLLLSPIFGSFLHMRNWRALGEKDKAETSRYWVIGSSLLLALSMLIAIFAPGADILIRLVGLGTLIGWYASSAKVQIQYVKDHFGTDYPRKGWLVPLLIAFGLFVVLVVLMVIVMTILLGDGGVRVD